MNAQIISSDSDNTVLQFSYKGIHRHLLLRDILFIESSERKCLIHTTDSPEESLCFYGKLSDIAESLYEYGFIRCHQSYLVSVKANLHYRDSRIYIDDLEIPVSERYRKRILNIFHSRSNDISPKTDSTKNTTGALVCIAGEYYGTIIKMYPNAVCSIGRDRETSEIVINLPYISRSHCDIIYRNNGEYELIDHSHNGTFHLREDGTAKKLSADKINILPAGAIICFGDKALQYRLI